MGQYGDNDFERQTVTIKQATSLLNRGEDVARRLIRGKDLPPIIHRYCASLFGLQNAAGPDQPLSHYVSGDWVGQACQ